jgi:hypothetical protein
MTKILTSIFLFLMLTSLAKAFDSDDMSEFRRPRPRPTIHRCCAKPSNGGVMNCSEDTDRLSAWADAIANCEDRYGKGNCVSGCRRLLPGERRLNQ